MKKAMKLALVLSVACMAGIFSGQQDAEAKKVKIRLAHDNNVQTPGHQAFVEFKKMVEADSNGEIEIQIFPGGQLGSVQDMFALARRGDIEMSVGATTLFTPTIPEFAVWDSFYMFDDAAHAHRVLDGKGGQELMKPLERMRLVGIGYSRADDLANVVDSITAAFSAAERAQIVHAAVVVVEGMPVERGRA